MRVSLELTNFVESVCLGVLFVVHWFECMTHFPLDEFVWNIEHGEDWRFDETLVCVTQLFDTNVYDIVFNNGQLKYVFDLFTTLAHELKQHIWMNSEQKIVAYNITIL